MGKVELRALSLIGELPADKRRGVRGAVRRLRNAGVPWIMIVSLLVKYGPQIIEIVIAAFQGKQSLKPWGID